MAKIQMTAPPAPGAATHGGHEAPVEEKHHWLRQLGDELFFVFVIVMFFKLFLVDLYKIPTGSMTPTLVGGQIARLDINGDGLRDLAYWLDEGSDLRTLKFMADGQGHLNMPQPPTASVMPEQDPRFVSPAESNAWRRNGWAYRRYDRILVNKTSYWFHDPRHGEIVVFKVPPGIWRPEAPIYIKRLVGEPGDRVTFDPHGLAMINGTLLEKPDFFTRQYYSTRVSSLAHGFGEWPEITYQPSADSPQDLLISEIRVPPGHAYVMGDNTLGSLDSRYWGGVPIEHFKGRAFLRVFPFKAAGWLK